MRLPDGDGPNRTCIVSRQQLPAEAMIRFVAAPDGQVVPDLKRKLPGRGVWVTATGESIAVAVRKNAFARSLKAPVTAAPDLALHVESLLLRDCLQSLSFANKAGAVVTGAFKISDAARKGIAALIHASGASEREFDKLEQKVRTAKRGDGAIPVVRLFTQEQLSLSLGREHVIHAAVMAGSLAENFLRSVQAVARYRREYPLPMTIDGEVAVDRIGVCAGIKDSESDE